MFVTLPTHLDVNSLYRVIIYPTNIVRLFLTALCPALSQRPRRDANYRRWVTISMCKINKDPVYAFCVYSTSICGSVALWVAIRHIRKVPVLDIFFWDRTIFTWFPWVPPGFGLHPLQSNIYLFSYNLMLYNLRNCVIKQTKRRLLHLPVILHTSTMDIYIYINNIYNGWCKSHLRQETDAKHTASSDFALPTYV